MENEIRCPHCNSVLDIKPVENPDKLMTIGELIEQLEKYSDELEIVAKFDGNTVYPRRIESWRGGRELPAIDFYEYQPQYMSLDILGSFVRELKDQIGKTMQGYKGGEYPIHKDLPIRLAQWGEVKSYAINYISDDEKYVILNCAEIIDDEC